MCEDNKLTADMQLAVKNAVEEQADKRGSKNFFRGLFATLVLIPLTYFAIQGFAERAAVTAAREAISQERTSWENAFKSVMGTAANAATEADSASRSALDAQRKAHQAHDYVEQTRKRAEEIANKLADTQKNLAVELGYPSKESLIVALSETPLFKEALTEARGFPVGTILPYYGTDLYTEGGTVDDALENKKVVYVRGSKNWVVCNGSTLQGRTVPDLTERFLLGALSLGPPGGKKKLPVKVWIANAHDSRNTNINGVSVGARGHSFTGSGHAEGFPPYVPVIFIMRIK